MAEISASAVRAEGIQPPISSSELFTECLSRNARNRLAFELLMANYLLNSDLDSLVPRLVELPRFGYNHIPRHYEEAALLFEMRHNGQKVDFGGLAIRDTTLARFRRFQMVIGQPYGAAGLGGAPSQRAGTLIAEFGDTYWFYFLFGETPGLADSRVKN
jgi:hypothetical protein